MTDGITEAYASIVEMYGNVSGELAVARQRVNELAAEVSDLTKYNRRLKMIVERRTERTDVLEDIIAEMREIIVEHTNFTYDDLNAIEREVERKFREGEEE